MPIIRHIFLQILGQLEPRSGPTWFTRTFMLSSFVVQTVLIYICSGSSVLNFP